MVINVMGVILFGFSDKLQLSVGSHSPINSSIQYVEVSHFRRMSLFRLLVLVEVLKFDQISWLDFGMKLLTVLIMWKEKKKCFDL